MPEITTIIFDIGDVLVNYSEKLLFRRFGYNDAMCERLAKASMRTPDWSQYDLGILPEKEIVDLFVENDPEIEDDLRKCFVDLKGIVTRRDTAIPWISRLKKQGLKIMICSNYSEPTVRDCWDAMDFLRYVDGGVMSYRDHVLKPNPDIFRLVMERAGSAPEECIFIDDMEKNVLAAAALGIHTVQYKNQKQAEEEVDRIIAACK